MLIPEASTSAKLVDLAFERTLVMEALFLLCVTTVMVFFVVKYHGKRNALPENVEGSTALEIIWTVIPTLLLLVIF